MRDECVWEFKTKRFSVVLSCKPEDYPDLSWADSETLEKLRTGEWCNFTFFVRIYCDGREVAAESLGNSIYADPVEFYREHIGIKILSRNDGHNYGCYFTDMIREAISKARETLCDVPRLRCQ